MHRCTGAQGEAHTWEIHVNSQIRLPDAAQGRHFFVFAKASERVLDPPCEMHDPTA